MTTRIMLAISVIMILAGSERGRAQTQANPNALDRIAWLVGGTWVAESKTPDGAPVTTEATYHFTSHRKAIRYSIVRKIEGKEVPVLEGLCGWHPGKKQLVIWEVDFEGNVTESILVVQDKTMSYNEMIFATAGSTQPVRAEAIREGDDQFVFRASVPKGGQWPVVFEARYQRRKG